MFDEISRTNLNQQVASKILSRILSGTLAPGDKLPPERELSEQFHINRNTLREALRQIENLGLLNVRQGDGIYVKDYRGCGNLELIKHMLYSDLPSRQKTIESILEIRGILIPEIAAKAALMISKEELREIKETIGDKSKSTLEKDLQIHHIIAKCSDNVFYIFILNFFNQIFRDLGAVYFQSEKNRKVSETFHRDILDAFTEADPEKAEEVMSRVLDYAEEQMIKQMGEKNETM